MTDDPDANALPPESLDPEPGGGGRPHAPTRGATVKAIPINPQLAGCGCFGCSSIVFLVAASAVAGAVWGFLIPEWRVNNRYVSTTCEVLDQRLDTQEFPDAGQKPAGAGPKESYRPMVKIRYEVNGRKLEAWTYDAAGIYNNNKATQQTILDNFPVGSIQPCWYDPDRPQQAVLVRGYAVAAYFFLIFPAVFLILGSVGMFFGWTIFRMGRPSRDGTPAPPAVWIEPPPQPAAFPRGFDPARLGDPLAEAIEWTPSEVNPLGLGGRKLVEIDPDRLEFRVTIWGRFWPFLALIVGLGLSTSIVASAFRRASLHLNSLVLLLLTLGLAASMGYLLHRRSIPIVFDRREGFFWRGRKPPGEFPDAEAPTDATPLDDIHALQLLLQLIRPSRGRDRRVYQLYLVRNDAERILVVVRSHRGRLREEAAVLGEFLGKPVWDAS